MSHKPYIVSLQQASSERLLVDLNAALEGTFIRAGKEFLRSKTDADHTIAKVKAMESIKQIIATYRKVRGKEAVTQALWSLNLAEFDTD